MKKNIALGMLLLCVSSSVYPADLCKKVTAVALTASVVVYGAALYALRELLAANLYID